MQFKLCLIIIIIIIIDPVPIPKMSHIIKNK